MKLLGNRLLVQPLPQKQKSTGGIMFPQQYRDDERQWVVVAVGTGRKLKDGTVVPIEVLPGSKVLIGEFGSNFHTFDDGSRIIDASEVVMSWL